MTTGIDAVKEYMARCRPAAAVERTETVKQDLKPRGLKAPLYLLPFAPLKWAARGFQFGISPGKYRRGNWRQPVDGEHPVQKAQEYLRAAAGHIWDQMEHFERYLESLEDPGSPPMSPMHLDQDPLGSRGPSLVGALCSLFMAIAFLVAAGFAPEDPGKTWEGKEAK